MVDVCCSGCRCCGEIWVNSELSLVREIPVSQSLLPPATTRRAHRHTSHTFFQRLNRNGTLGTEDVPVQDRAYTHGLCIVAVAVQLWQWQWPHNGNPSPPDLPYSSGEAAWRRPIIFPLQNRSTSDWGTVFCLSIFFINVN